MVLSPAPLGIQPFEVVMPRRLVFGCGRALELASWVSTSAGVGSQSRVLLVTGKSPRHGHVQEALAQVAELVPFEVSGEPTLELAEEALSLARTRGVTCVVALGGGSAIDLGKVVAALTRANTRVLDHLEVVGSGLPLRTPGLPFAAVPTTAGTGAEATKNAVLAVRRSEDVIKVSLRADSMVPTLALIDPELTLSVPFAVTMATGLDALTQVIEPYVSNAANAMTDAWTRDAIPRAARALPRLAQDLGDLAARTDMALVSMLGGLSLANAKLGAVHGFAGPLGGHLGAPHGVLCARLLPHVIEANCAALSAREPNSPALARYAEVSRWLTGAEDALVGDGIDWLHRLLASLHIPTLASLGLRRADVPRMAEHAARASSMKGNPISLEANELVRILEAAMD